MINSRIFSPFIRLQCLNDVSRYFFLILFLFSPSLLANDSIVTVGAGGITLQKTDQIVMRSEDLYLSLDQVKVHYVFENVSNEDIKTMVAFPLPPLETDEGELSVDPNQPNPMSFQVKVDGKPVSTQIERKQIPPNKAKITYYWEQVFPKNKKIGVEHTYKPGIGGYLLNPGMDPSGTQRSSKTYCIDPLLLKWIEKISQKTGGVMPVKELIYILSTGSHWKGPIGDFRLIVDKGNPERKIAFCMDGVKKISPTQFEVKKKNFTPTRDIRIAFFEP